MYKLEQNLLPNKGEVYLLNLPNSNLFNAIIQKSKWRNDKVKVFGKIFDQPRKVAWNSNENVEYSYSGITLPPTPWISEVHELKQTIEIITKETYNSALINLYRNGQDYMGWHSDDEYELGPNPTIVSYSLGVPRDFIFRMKENHKIKVSLSLKDGDLLIMKGQTQHFWQHSLPKRLKVDGQRINITFRKINPTK